MHSDTIHSPRPSEPVYILVFPAPSHKGLFVVVNNSGNSLREVFNQVWPSLAVSAWCAIARTPCFTLGWLEWAHPLLQTAPVNDWPWLEDVELGSEALALLLEIHNGRLPDENAIDGTDGRQVGRSIRVAVAAVRRRWWCWRGPAEWCPDVVRVEAGREGLEPWCLHVGWYWVWSKVPSNALVSETVGLVVQLRRQVLQKAGRQSRIPGEDIRQQLRKRNYEARNIERRLSLIEVKQYSFGMLMVWLGCLVVVANDGEVKVAGLNDGTMVCSSGWYLARDNTATDSSEWFTARRSSSLDSEKEAR